MRSSVGSGADLIPSWATPAKTETIWWVGKLDSIMDKDSIIFVLEVGFSEQFVSHLEMEVKVCITQAGCADEEK